MTTTTTNAPTVTSTTGLHFRARIARYAELDGSSARTLRGQVRAALRPRRAVVIRALARSAGLVQCPHTYPRPQLSEAEREDRRAAADPRFRRTLRVRLQRQLAAPVAGDLATRYERDAALRARLALISPRAQRGVVRVVALDLHESTADYVGWDRRGADAEWSCGVRYGLDYTPGHTTWRNGRPRSYTRAQRTTTIAALAATVAGGLRIYVKGRDRTIDVTIPGASVADLGPTKALLGGDLICVGVGRDRYQRYDHRGRACGVAIVSGGGWWAHGADAAEATAELQHWIERQAAQRRIARQTDRDARAVRLLARLSTAAVSATEARAAGYCRQGIEAWCARRGVDPTSAVEVRRLARDTDPLARELGALVAGRLWHARGVSDIRAA